MPLKILHVIPSIAPRTGGPAEAVLGMVSACRREGVDALIATTNADGPSRLEVPTGRIVTHRGAPTIFFDWQLSTRFQYSRPFAVWMNRHVSDFAVVHIHAIFSHASLTAARAARRHGVPYIVRPLGSLDPWSLDQRRLGKRVIWHLIVRRLLAGASAIHYTTREEQRRAEDPLGLTNGVVIPLGIERPAARNAAPDGRCVLSLGRLHPKKNIELLMDAFAALIARRPDFDRWRLLIVGDGDPHYVRTLRDHAAALGMARIDFAGWLMGDQKRAAIEAAALVALVSRQENFGLVLLESLAAGVPVLVTPDVNLAADIEDADCGWVCRSELPAMTDALERILTDAPERLRRGAIGHEFAARFSWPTIARRLEELYAEIANRADVGTAHGAWHAT